MEGSPVQAVFIGCITSGCCGSDGHPSGYIIAEGIRSDGHGRQYGRIDGEGLRKDTTSCILHGYVISTCTESCKGIVGVKRHLNSSGCCIVQLIGISPPSIGSIHGNDGIIDTGKRIDVGSKCQWCCGPVNGHGSRGIGTERIGVIGYCYGIGIRCKPCNVFRSIRRGSRRNYGSR